MKAIVFYHRNCNDGTGAALAIKLWVEGHLGNKANINVHDIETDSVKYVAINYGDDFNYILGKQDLKVEDLYESLVFVIDFSLPLPIFKGLLLNMSKTVQGVSGRGKLVWLDHHDTARKVWNQLFPHYADQNFAAGPCYEAHLVHDESGASMAYKWVKGDPIGRSVDEALPKFFWHLRDYDLWLHESSCTKAFTFALEARGRDLNDWVRYFDDFQAQYGADDPDLYAEGKSIERWVNTNIDAGIKGKFLRQRVELRGTDGKWYTGMCYHGMPLNWADFISDRYYKLNKDEPDQADFIAVVAFLGKKKLVTSVRSQNGYAILVAENNGGGGHKNSAGFQLIGDKQIHESPLSPVTW